MQQVFLSLIIVFAFLSVPVRAEFILDDFDDAAEVASFSPPSQPAYAVTEHVGDLDVIREMAVTALLTEPNFRLDAAIRSDSVLTATLDGHTRTGVNSPNLSFFASYDLPSVDLTDNGNNNALLFDFRSSTGTELPLVFRVGVRGPSLANTNVGVSSDYRFSDTPYTATIPFASFGTRGGGVGSPDLTAVDELIVDFFFLRPSTDIQWSAELDRIRVGRVPEPATLILLGFSSIVFASRHSRRVPGATAGLSSSAPLQESVNDGKRTIFRSQEKKAGTRFTLLGKPAVPPAEGDAILLLFGYLGFCCRVARKSYLGFGVVGIGAETSARH